MTDEQAVRRIVTHLDKLGWTVDLEAEEMGSIGGRCYYVRRRIKVNAGLSTAMGLLYLAHEAGHALHHDRNPDLLKNDTMGLKAEEMAYMYGWAILARLNKRPDKGFWRWLHNHVDFSDKKGVNGARSQTSR